MKYNFYVKDALEINFQRIADEAPSDVSVILVTSPKAKEAKLMIRIAWLSRFDYHDRIMVDLESLNRSWGFSEVSTANYETGISLASGGSVSHVEGWRVRVIATNSIPSIIEQISKAKEFSPKREVRVTYL